MLSSKCSSFRHVLDTLILCVDGSQIKHLLKLSWSWCNGCTKYNLVYIHVVASGYIFEMKLIMIWPDTGYPAMLSAGEMLAWIPGERSAFHMHRPDAQSQHALFTLNWSRIVFSLARDTVF